MAGKLPIDLSSQFVSGLRQLILDEDANEKNIRALKASVNISDKKAQELTRDFIEKVLVAQNNYPTDSIAHPQGFEGIQVSMELYSLVDGLDIDQAKIPNLINGIKLFVDSLPKGDEPSLAISFDIDFKNPRVELRKIKDGIGVASYDYAPNKKCSVFIRLSFEDMKTFAENKYRRDPMAGVGSYKVAYSLNKNVPIIEVQYNNLFERVCTVQNIEDEAKKALLTNVGGAVRLCDGVGKSNYYPFIGRDLKSCRAIKDPKDRFVRMGYCRVGSKQIPFFLEVSDADLKKYSFTLPYKVDEIDKSEEEILDLMRMDYKQSNQMERLERCYNLNIKRVQTAVAPHIVDIISQKKLDTERGLFVSKDGSYCSRDPREGFYAQVTYITFIGQFFQLFVEISNDDITKIKNADETEIENFFEIKPSTNKEMGFTRHYKEGGEWKNWTEPYRTFKATNAGLCKQSSQPISKNGSTFTAHCKGNDGCIKTSDQQMTKGALKDIFNEAQKETVIQNGSTGLNKMKNIQFFQYKAFDVFCKKYNISVDQKVNLGFEAAGKAHQMRSEMPKGALLFSKDFKRIERMVRIPEIAVDVARIEVLDINGEVKKIFVYKESDSDEVNSVMMEYHLKEELQRNYTTFNLSLVADMYCNQTQRNLTDIKSLIKEALIDRLKEKDPSRCLVITKNGDMIVSETQVPDESFLVVLGNVYLEGKIFVVEAELSKEDCDAILEQDNRGLIPTYNQIKGDKIHACDASTGDSQAERTIEEHEKEVFDVFQSFEGYLYNRSGVTPGQYSFLKRAEMHFEEVRNQAIEILKEQYKINKEVNLDEIKFEDLFDSRGYTKELMEHYKAQYDEQIKICVSKLASYGSIPDRFFEETEQAALIIYEQHKNVDPEFIGELMAQCFNGYELLDKFDDIKDVLKAKGVSNSNLNAMAEGFEGELYLKYVSMENDELLEDKRIEEQRRTLDQIIEHLKIVLVKITNRYPEVSKDFFLRLALTQYHSSGLLQRSDISGVYNKLKEEVILSDAQQIAQLTNGMQEFQFERFPSSAARVVNIGSEPKQTGLSETERARLQKKLEARQKRKKETDAPVVDAESIRRAQEKAAELEKEEEAEKAARIARQEKIAAKKAKKKRMKAEKAAKLEVQERLAKLKRKEEAENRARIKEQERLAKLKRKEEAEKKEAEAQEAAAKAKSEATKRKEIKAKIKKVARWLEKNNTAKAKAAYDVASKLIGGAKFLSETEASDYNKTLKKLEPLVKPVLAQSTVVASKKETVPGAAESPTSEAKPVLEKGLSGTTQVELLALRGETTETASNNGESVTIQEVKVTETTTASALNMPCTTDRSSESDPEEQGKLTPKKRSKSLSSRDQEIEPSPQQFAKMQKLERLNDVSKRKINLQQLGLDDQQIVASASNYVKARLGGDIEDELMQTVETYKNLNVPENTIRRFCDLVRSYYPTSVQEYGSGQPVSAYGYPQPMMPQPMYYGYYGPQFVQPPPQFYQPGYGGTGGVGPALGAPYGHMMPSQQVVYYPNGGVSNYVMPQAPNPSNQTGGKIPDSLVMVAGGNMELARYLHNAFIKGKKGRFNHFVRKYIPNESIQKLAMSYFNDSKDRRRKNK